MEPAVQSEAVKKKNTERVAMQEREGGFQTPMRPMNKRTNEEAHHTHRERDDCVCVCVCVCRGLEFGTETHTEYDIGRSGTVGE